MAAGRRVQDQAGNFVAVILPVDHPAEPPVADGGVFPQDIAQAGRTHRLRAGGQNGRIR